MAESTTLSCPSCGAPTPHAHGDSVVLCSYCGSAILTSEGDGPRGRVEAHYVLENTIHGEDLDGTLRRALRKRLLASRILGDVIRRKDPQARLLPYWVVRVHAETRWTGSDVLHHVEERKGAPRDDPAWSFDDEAESPTGIPLSPRPSSSHRSVHHEKRYVPRDGSFENRHSWPVYGRRGEEFWGQDALRPGGPALRPDWGNYPLGLFGASRAKPIDLLRSRKPFAVDDLPETMALLAGHVDPREAERQAREEIEAAAWKQAKGRVSVLHECKTSVRIEETALVHLPLWWIDYEWRGKSYHALFAGDTGTLLALSYPVSPWIKVLVTLLSAFVTTLLASLLEGARLPPTAERLLRGLVGLLWIVTLLHGLWTAATEWNTEDTGGSQDVT